LEFFCNGPREGGSGWGQGFTKKKSLEGTYQPQGHKLTNADKIVKFLTTKNNNYHVAHSTTHKNINKLFWDVKVGEVDKSKPINYETICGNYNMHQIQSIPNKDPTLLQCHNIPFFCVVCMDRIPNGRCDNEHHVLAWTLKKLMNKKVFYSGIKNLIVCSS